MSIVTITPNPCPLSIKSIQPVSFAPQAYDEPVSFKFEIDCEYEMQHGFEIFFYYMDLSGDNSDILLDSFEVDALTAGSTEFELDFEMPAVDKIPFDELIGSHGIEIKFKYQDEFVARRGCELVIMYKDEKLMEEDMPDEILAEHLLVKSLGIRGPKNKVTKATEDDTMVEAISNSYQQQATAAVASANDNNNNTASQQTNTTATETSSENKSSLPTSAGQIRQRDEKENSEAGNNVSQPEMNNN